MNNSDELNKLVIFKDKTIRRILHNNEWWFSVVDVVGALTDSSNPGAYWRKLKQRLNEEKSEVVTNCHGLKLTATDGKKYITDCANTESLLRIIQSIPSPKAEPFKQWLAKVGYERIQEISDPEKSIDRARDNWKRHGRSEKWIQQRMMGQETRNKLTDYWKNHEVTKESEFAILTNIIHQEWTGISIKEHKNIKGLKNQNLRDHMNEAELIFTALAELSTRQVAETNNATGMEENKIASKIGGGIAKNAKTALENKTGKKVISTENYLPPKLTK
ncbi:BRO family, N-terminal domain protein [Rickettsia felis str. Pedreira]|uniref:BRO family, N-terminal domain protein n=2 Tax=Rickettsia felis TaxID=42862 RepID=A0A0F3MVI3_RICFI|nr:Bro-N domain-containing protein [Rickettsia felis]AAY62248.1 Prophage antirepressor [Rickettsia felis URRWXCal2]KHO04139.1 antirepressor [Rickettsia felis]KJV58559.1 BRO family, N-terminal domain protein [Rickettsia felis str. Pedreira]MDE8611571.1 Bro-N domain-containing protein [Rickettsia felis]